jgi:hypothetical protein
MLQQQEEEEEQEEEVANNDQLGQSGSTVSTGMRGRSDLVDRRARSSSSNMNNTSRPLDTSMSTSTSMGVKKRGFVADPKKWCSNASTKNALSLTTTKSSRRGRDVLSESLPALGGVAGGSYATFGGRSLSSSFKPTAMPQSTKLAADFPTSRTIMQDSSTSALRLKQQQRQAQRETELTLRAEEKGFRYGTRVRIGSGTRKLARSRSGMLRSDSVL